MPGVHISNARENVKFICWRRVNFMLQMFTLDRTVMISEGLTKHKYFWHKTQTFITVLIKACFGVCIPFRFWQPISQIHTFFYHPCQITFPMQIYTSAALAIPLRLADRASCLSCSDMYWEGAQIIVDWSSIILTAVSCWFSQFLLANAMTVHSFKLHHNHFLPHPNSLLFNHPTI